MDGDVYREETVSFDWTTDEELEFFSETEAPTSSITANGMEVVTGTGEASSSTGVPKSNLVKQFVGMGFPEKIVLKAIEEHGGDTENMLNTLLTYSNLEDSPQEQLSFSSDPSSSDYKETIEDDIPDMDSWSENEVEDCTGSMVGKETDKRLLLLANMGYSVEEASEAIERCGPEASLEVLTDFICAGQVAREEDCYLQEDDLKKKHVIPGYSKKKKRKIERTNSQNAIQEEPIIRLPDPMIGFGVPSQQLLHIDRSLPPQARGPPYFYYENVALAPKGTWETISRCLYDIQPEFVDSTYFSASARKRGYVHNLPIQNRRPLLPSPPLTISEALPLTKKWWPSWDPRKKFNCLQTSIACAKLTKILRDKLEKYGDDPPEPVKKYILTECRKWNLVWIGWNKAAPLEAEEVEMLLGFPKDHTRGGGMSRTDRYKSLGNSFQVDTVAYHLSVLKDMYPNGINVLSLFSGIGGAEVALHRLGIRIKNVVSVEKSKANQDVVSSWWEESKQRGRLEHIDDIQGLDEERLEAIMNEIGRPDLVIGGSPCNNLAGSNRHHRDGLKGEHSSLFYDYCRVLEIVRRYQG